MIPDELQKKYNEALLKIDTLIPEMQVMIRELMAKGDELLSPYKIVPRYGYRTLVEQDEIYEKGRTKPGNIVTLVKGGYSFHNVRRAIDLAIVNPTTGQAIWEKPLFDKLAAVKNEKLEWGGAWKELVDLPHFQYCWCEKHKTNHNKAINFNENGECQL